MSSPLTSLREEFESVPMPLATVGESDRPFHFINQSIIYLDDGIPQKNLSVAQNVTVPKSQGGWGSRDSLLNSSIGIFLGDDFFGLGVGTSNVSSKENVTRSTKEDDKLSKGRLVLHYVSIPNSLVYDGDQDSFMKATMNKPLTIIEVGLGDGVGVMLSLEDKGKEKILNEKGIEHLIRELIPTYKDIL